MEFFIIFFMAILFASINQTSQESTVHKYGVAVHGSVKFMLMSFFMMISILISNTIFKMPIRLDFKINLTYKSVIAIIAITFLAIGTTYLFNKMLEHGEIYSLGVLMKLSILIVLFIDIVLGNIIFKWDLLFYVIIFLLGILIMFDVHLLKGHHIKSDMKKAKFIIPIFLISIIMPYIKRVGINSGWFNNETLIVISNFLISFIFMMKFKPKLNIKIFKDYLFQSAACTVAMFSYTVIISSYGVFYYKLANTITLIGIAILSKIFLKTKITKRKYIGMIIAGIGFFLISINV